MRTVELKLGQQTAALTPLYLKPTEDETFELQKHWHGSHGGQLKAFLSDQ